MIIPNVLTNLGYCLNIEFFINDDLYEIKFAVKDKYIIASNDKGTSLFIFRSKKTDNNQKFDKRKVHKCASLFESWSDFEADSAYVHKVNTTSLKQSGKAYSIIYRSDKWTGKNIDYIHHFKNNVKIKLDRLTNPRMIKIYGGKMKVKEVGITG